MTDFDYDCLERKRLAKQAKYRKCGSKSHKCTMSTDNMTQKQWKERNGKVVTLNLKRPISWPEFKSLTTLLQEEYIRHLMSTYNANATKLSEMFGVGTQAIKGHFQKNGIDIRFHVGHSMTNEQRMAWDEFLRGGSYESKPSDEPHDTTEQEQRSEMNMTNFSLSFDGKIDINMIANSLLHILGRDAIGEVQIICNLAKGVS